MGIYRPLNNIVQYIYEAAARIFGPTDDAYPPTGVQPYSGEPYRENNRRVDR